jgi:hypothetical protein
MAFLPLCVASHEPILHVDYDRKRKAIIVKRGGGYYDEGPNETYRVKTPFGVATVAIEHDHFPSYPNVDTGPEGFALAIRTPKDVSVELRFKGEIDTVIVDNRRIGFSRPRPTSYRCRLAGGEHLFEVAWPPSE